MIQAGKPIAPIYTRALGDGPRLRGATLDARVLAIGDAMRTDVAGRLRRG